MTSSIISTELRHFGEKTSVAGISHIFNSRTRVHRLLWLLGVITCAAVLIWQLTVLFTRYLSYPVNTLFAKSPDYDNATFPDITICNLFPLVNEKETGFAYSDYLQAVIEQFTLEKFQKYAGNDYDKSRDKFDQIQDALASPDAYFLNFPMLKRRSNIAQNFPILDCNYFDWNYQKNFKTSNPYCVARMEKIWDPDYYTCYVLKLPDAQRKNIRGFAAVVYVEDYEDSVLKNYSLDLRRNRATGMQVVVHAPGTKPNMKLGVSIGPGLSTTIAMDQTKVSYLPDPYSKCTNRKTVGSSQNDPYTYTKPYCVDVCTQKQYMQQCNCLESTLQFTPQQLQEIQYRICGNLSIQTINAPFRWDGINEIICVNALVPDQSKCDKECSIPCQEFQYSSSTNAAPWPHISVQFSVYETYVKNNPLFGRDFDGYDSAFQYAFSNVTAAHDLLVKLDRQGTMKGVLLQLNIKMNSPTYSDLKQTVSYTLDALGSQVGGTLAVWLNVTIIVIFEIFEFFVNALHGVCQYKRNGSTIPQNFADTKL